MESPEQVITERLEEVVDDHLDGRRGVHIGSRCHDVVEAVREILKAESMSPVRSEARWRWASAVAAAAHATMRAQVYSAANDIGTRSHLFQASEFLADARRWLEEIHSSESTLREAA